MPEVQFLFLFGRSLVHYLFIILLGALLSVLLIHDQHLLTQISAQKITIAITPSVIQCALLATTTSGIGFTYDKSSRVCRLEGGVPPENQTEMAGVTRCRRFSQGVTTRRFRGMSRVPLFATRALSGHPVYTLFTSALSNSSLLLTNWTSNEWNSSAPWYKSPLFDSWSSTEGAPFPSITLELLTNEKIVCSLTFNATGSTIESWFQADRLTSAFPWDTSDLQSTTFFSIAGFVEFRKFKRRFYISMKQDNCIFEKGFLGVFDAPDDCPYVTGVSQDMPLPPVFIFTFRSGVLGPQKWDSPYAMKTADELRISANFDAVIGQQDLVVYKGDSN